MTGGRGDGIPRPPGTLIGRGQAPAFPPGAIRVNDTTLSGNVVKIGSAYASLGDAKPWKYLVLYVDQRGPMKSGITGIVRSHAASSFVASVCCTVGLNAVFHWFRRPVALASEKCSQLPVEVPSSP